jgi:hypothetical protein
MHAIISEKSPAILQIGKWKIYFSLKWKFKDKFSKKGDASKNRKKSIVIRLQSYISTLIQEIQTKRFFAFKVCPFSPLPAAYPFKDKRIIL